MASSIESCSKCKNWARVLWRKKKRCFFIIIYFVSYSCQGCTLPSCAGFWTQKHISNRTMRKTLLIFPSFTSGPFKARLKGKGTCGCGRKEHMASALVENLSMGLGFGTRCLTSINMLSELFWQNTHRGTLAQHCSQECYSVSLPTCHLSCIMLSVFSTVQMRIQTCWRISVHQISSQKSGHEYFLLYESSTCKAYWRSDMSCSLILSIYSK